MAYEWERLIWWMGQNSSAIQALSSVATVLITLTLVVVTIRYVRLTHGLAKTAQIQLETSIQPDVEVYFTLSGITSEGNFAIHNKGVSPLKLRRVEIQGRVFKAEWTGLEALDFGGMRGLIIAGQKEITQQFSFTKQVIKVFGWPDHQTARCEFALCLTCADARGFFEHSYKYTPEQGLRYYSVPKENLFQSKAYPPKPSRNQLDK